MLRVTKIDFLQALNRFIRFPVFLYLRARQALIERWLRRKARLYWCQQSLLTLSQTHAAITAAIDNRQPFALGRLGGVEASIIRWGKRIPNHNWRPELRPIFADTATGATNAGIRPRNRKSYRLFADIAWEALKSLDLQGVWYTGYEAVCLESLNPRICFEGETIVPDAYTPLHWMLALENKTVLVVSPFTDSISSQIPKFNRIWADRQWSPNINFQLIQFPYLIDDSCPDTWWDVYHRIGDQISQGSFDVALFGCGGLGLPFAALAKQAGKVGIHIGGHLQLLFGIYGKRHLEQEWIRSCINEAWVRPRKNEVPESSQRIEGGCYW